MALASLGRDPPPFFRQGPSALSRLLVFSALALLVMVADARFQMMQPVRSVIASVLYPVQWLAMQPLAVTQAADSRLASLMADESAWTQLQQKLSEQSLRANQADHLQLENKRLRELLALQQRLEQTALAAQVLYDAADPYSRKVIVDKGLVQGLRLGARCLVHRVGVLVRCAPDAGRSAHVWRAHPLRVIYDICRRLGRLVCRGGGPGPENPRGYRARSRTSGRNARDQLARRRLRLATTAISGKRPV